jgi:exodeoxyribonuclease VII small subunit
MSSGTPDTSAAPPPERFDELLLRLRSLVERLEGGNLSLEDGLRCFEEGMTLCRRGSEILDGAERRVEVLLGSGKEIRTAPLAGATHMRDQPGQQGQQGIDE